jgi:hypothetical protein
MNGTPKVIETGPILRLSGGKKAYERFVLAGISESHNEEYYAVEDQRFLGDEGFGEELSREGGLGLGSDIIFISIILTMESVV